MYRTCFFTVGICLPKLQRFWLMHRSFVPIFSAHTRLPPCHDWFAFVDFEYIFFPPPEPERRTTDIRYKQTSCFYCQAPPSSYWILFSTDRKNRFAEEWTAWYELYDARGRPGFCFQIDDVYCGADFIMVKIADPRWPRWMVVWILHSLTQSSCHGRLKRRLRFFAWKATHRAAASKRRPSICDIGLQLAFYSTRS